MLGNDLVRRFCALPVLLLALTFCAADGFPDYPALHPGDCSVRVESAGLVIGVQPIDDLKDQKLYFRTELTPKGFLPVYIVMENASSGDSFHFDKTGITYGEAGAADSAPSDPNVGRKRGTVSTIFIAGGGLAGLAAGHRIAEAGDEEINIMKKELYSGTISAGTSLHGFLYLTVRNDTPRQKLRLRVPIINGSTGKGSVMEMVF
jgi:hypothetical protein